MFGDKKKKYKRFVSKEIISFGLGTIEIIVDTQTGVNYILSHEPSGLTPLLDASGKVVIEEVATIFNETP